MSYLMANEIREEEGAWTEENNVKQLLDYLKKSEVSFQIKHHTKTVYTSEEAAK